MTEHKPVAWRNPNGVVTNFQHGADAWEKAGISCEPLYDASLLSEYESVKRERDEATSMARVATIGALNQLEACNAYLARAEAAEAETKRLRELLENTRSIVCDGALTGFNCHEGDWAIRLYRNNGDISEALRDREALEDAR